MPSPENGCIAEISSRDILKLVFFIVVFFNTYLLNTINNFVYYNIVPNRAR